MRRENLVASLTFFLVVLTVFGAVVLSAKQVEPLNQRQVTSHIEVRLQIVQLLNERCEFELSAHNSGSEPVFIMTAPMRSNGSKGSYFTLDPQDPSRLNIGLHLFPPPNYSIYANHTHVTLKRLDPGSTHLEQITLAFPAKETSPPYKGASFEFETFDRAKIREVRAAVGILPDDEGIRDFVRRKQGRGLGPNAGGLELVQKGPHQGKSLYEVQEIVWTSTLKL